MKTLKTLSAVMLMAASMMSTSCLNSDTEGITVTANYTQLFNAVFGPDGNLSLYPNQSVKVEWGYDTPTKANVNILGLQIPNVGSFPSMSFTDVPWQYNNKGWMEISLTNAKPVPTAGYVANLTFDKFNLQTISRTYNGASFPPCINISYIIDNQYQVYAFPSQIVEMGSTTVTNSETGSSFTQEAANRSIYYIMIDPSNKNCFVVVQGAQFATNMPGLNMKFPAIPFTVNRNGSISFEKELIEPSLMSSASDINQAGTPAPDYPISNFKASYVPSTGLTISFDCSPQPHGVAIGTYHVEFSCKYPTSSSDTKI